MGPRNLIYSAEGGNRVLRAAVPVGRGALTRGFIGRRSIGAPGLVEKTPGVQVVSFIQPLAVGSSGEDD